MIRVRLLLLEFAAALDLRLDGLLNGLHVRAALQNLAWPWFLLADDERVRPLVKIKVGRLLAVDPMD